MKRLLTLLALAPLCTGCLAAAAGVGAGYIVSQQVLPGYVHQSDVMIDVEYVWPSVKETVGFYREPGTDLAVQESPRKVEAKVDGAKVEVEVEVIDIDHTRIRVQAEKYLARDEATASRVMKAIVQRLNEYEDQY